MRQSYQVVDRLSTGKEGLEPPTNALEVRGSNPTELLALEYLLIIRCLRLSVKALRYLSNTYSSPWNRTSQILLMIQSIVKHKKRGVVRPL